MTEWWEKAYPGGKMVAVKGFPRPLYPPDAAPNYKPSTDGSDVEAYKRTVSRAGRWVWQKFDQAYSNNFAHGKPGGNVPETGIAGVQRQNGLQDTGYVGEKTFNLLRSIIIPKPLPHAGEYAMDATAVELINAAWERFKGKEDQTPTGKISLGSVGEGPSVREYDLTHATSGIPLYPAFDAVWYTGKNVLAPEGMKVTRVGTASHGIAFYADGDSGLRWWFGHLDYQPTVGRYFARGDIVGHVAYHSDSPHVHVGVNVERLWGAGKQMSHHTNYTHGGPLIGAQLDAGHAL